MAKHAPSLQSLAGLPAEIEAGAAALLEVHLACPDGCDLRGGAVELTTPQGGRETQRLTAVEEPRSGGGPVSASFPVLAPARPGEAVWVVCFPAQAVSGVDHGESTLAVRATVVPHSTSMAIWDVPSPLQGSEFSVRVGVKCSSRCVLGGHLVEVRDDAGAVVGRGVLGPTPLAGTDALYEASVTLRAPDRPGIGSRRAIFVARDLALPHGESSGAFTFRCLERPEHTVTVRVVPDGTEASMADIEVRLGGYGAYTGPDGVARIAVPRGPHDLSAWRLDLEPISTRLDVTGDAEVEVVAAPRRVVDEDAKRWA